MEVPTHISIIMDGNGRWAKKQGKRRLFGHNAGVEAVRDATTYCAETGVRYLSILLNRSSIRPFTSSAGRSQFSSEKANRLR